MYRAGSQDRGLTFDEVAAAALRESGTITVKGNFSTPVEAQGGRRYRGATVGSSTGYSYAAQGRRGQRRRGDRPGHRRAGLGRPRLRQGPQSAGRGRTGPGLGVDGHGAGDERRDGVCERPPLRSQHARLPGADDRRLASHRRADRREQRSPRARSGRRRRARARSRASSPPSPARWRMPWPCGWTSCRVTPDRVWRALERRRREAERAARTKRRGAGNGEPGSASEPGAGPGTKPGPGPGPATRAGGGRANGAPP